ncbi:hypothetical protein HIM_02168 [Hirsutella minnesotensis 3608]|nr:hypothetical protein HIM_02168 [Hirsutella minnesotensis 3608]
MPPPQDSNTGKVDMAGSTADKEATAAIRRLTFKDAADGEDIYYFMGIRVIQHVTSTGHVLALKVKTATSLARSEADMMQYAATNGILAPQVRRCYDIVTLNPAKPIARVLAADRAPGLSLDVAWERYTDAEKESIKAQLREQLARMRACTLPYIGRVGRQPTRNVYDRLRQTYCGPFETEKAFDDWCVSRIDQGPVGRWRWRRAAAKMRGKTVGKFVLTHGDLTPRNIMVEGAVITGIVDWERSSFLPEYAEYAFAMKLCHEHEDWWIPILKELLQPCCERRLEMTRLVEDRGW